MASRKLPELTSILAALRALGFSGADAVADFQRAWRLDPTGVLDEETIYLVLDVHEAHEIATRSGRTGQSNAIRGTITSRTGEPAPDLEVQLVEQAFREQKKIGSTHTNANGEYALAYPRDVATAKDALIVRVLDGGAVAAESAAQFTLPPLLRLDLTVDNEHVHAPTEFERLVTTVGARIGTVAIADLQAADADFLSAALDTPIDQVRNLVVAHRLTAVSKIQPAFFYALLREGTLLGVGTGKLIPRFTIDLSTPIQPLYYDIVLVPDATLRSVVASAVGDRVVPAAVADALDGILATLASAAPAAKRYYDVQHPQDLLKTLAANISAGKHLEVLAAVQSRVDPVTLADKLAAIDFVQPTASTISGADLGQALAQLVSKDPGLIDALQSLTTKLGPPNAIARQAPARGSGALSATAAFADHLAADAAAPLPNANRLAALLRANPTFDLATGRVDTLVGATAATEPANTDAALRDSLKAVQRVFKLAPTYPQTKALLDSGIHSAAQIAAMGEAQFVKRFSTDGTFSAAQARTVFRKAVDVHTAAGMLAAELRSTSGASAAALMAPTVVAKLKAVSQSVPNLKNLFQLVDLCECKSCNAVDSPAAYLVDVLEFIGNRTVADTTQSPPVVGKNAKDVLFARRPDLGDIDLTCDNTNVPLPYVDVVCELLEQAVAPDPGFAYSGALAPGVAPATLVTALQHQHLDFTNAAYVQEPDKAGNFYVRAVRAVCKLVPGAAANSWTVYPLRQTFRGADELAAMPEYVNDAAYQLLQTAPTAFHLPYDLFFQETRAYFTQFDVRRDALMRALADAAGPTDGDIAADALGLSSGERDLIVTPRATAADQSRYWNTGTTDPATVVNVVDTFLTRTELDYADLQNLLQRQFINPSNTLFIHHNTLDCDTTQQIIANLDDAALDRIHRFLRLQKRLAWDLATLDRAIVAARIGNGVLDDACLVQLVALTQLQQRLGVTLDDAITWFGTISTEGVPSPYAQLFLSTTRLGTIDPALQIDAVAANPSAATPKTLTDVQSSLALAFAASVADVSTVIAALTVDPIKSPPLNPTPLANDVLSFASLAALDGELAIARALGRTASDLVLLEAMTSINPLAKPTEAVRFVVENDKVAAAGVKPDDLRFLLSFQATDVNARTLKDPAITAILGPLQQALQTAFLRTRSQYDPARTADQNADAVRSLVGRLPGITPTQLKKLQLLLDDRYQDPTTPAQQFLDDLLTPFPIDRTAIDAALNALVALGPPPPPPTPQPASFDAARSKLMQILSDAISKYLYQLARDAAVTSAIASGLGADADVTIAIVQAGKMSLAGGNQTLVEILGSDSLIDKTNDPPQPPPITPAAFPDQYAAVRLTRQILAFASSEAGLATSDLQWLLQHDGALGWLDLDQLPYQTGAAAIPYAKWGQLQDALALISRYPAVANADDATHPWTFKDVFEAALAPTTTISALLSLLSTASGWSLTVLTDLDSRFALSTPDLSKYRDPATYLRLEATVVPLRKLGLAVSDGTQLTIPVLTANETQLLRQALKARYSASEWLGVLKQIYDPLRQQKRDALVAYLLANNPGFTSSDDLFDYFLVDVELCSCQPTSRIVSAHGSLQLFVQRCLLGIEPTAVADVKEDGGWTQWQWMQAYRLWQANRQVFLYPENWIQPTLRDDKSEPFVALENSLQQSALDDDSITTATNAYLEALDKLAFLEVVTLYYEQSTTAMHVFARTKGGDPPTYYHRQFVEEKTWTPWKKIDLDIKGNHLIAFIRNGRLTLAWPIFTRDPNPKPSAKIPGTADLGTTVSTTTEQRWKIQIALSEFANGAWTPSITSQDPVYWPPSGYLTELPDERDFRFIAFDARFSNFVILCSYNYRQYSDVFAHFALNGCKGYPDAYQTGQTLVAFLPLFQRTLVKNERYLEDRSNENALAIETIFSLPQYVTILNQTPLAYRVTTPQQVGLIDFIVYFLLLLSRAGRSRRGSVNNPSIPIPLGTFMPFWYEDGEHNYVIVPGWFSPSVQIDAGPASPGTRTTISDVIPIAQEAAAIAKKYLSDLKKSPPDIAGFIQHVTNDPQFPDVVKKIRELTQLSFGYEFDNSYHPLVCPLRRTLYAQGLDALLARDTQLMTNANFDFNANYAPAPNVQTPYPSESIEFGDDGFYPVPSYASYNWELFFHMPFEVATRLSAAQSFDGALRWYHYIFNPMDASSATAPQKYWRTKPFFLRTNADYVAERIDKILNGLDTSSGGVLQVLQEAVRQWREHPYQPFVVARARTVAFQQTILMHYLDNLIAWGDSLFRQNTMESVNQATQMYILADKLLGPKPRIVPPVAEPEPETYNQLAAKSIDVFGNAILDLESLIPDLSLLPHGGAELPPPPLNLTSLYFCIPPNPKLLQYWDTVADRLFKIRHCQDINGVERTLALFAPPIDPGALVAAAAAGISPSQLLQGLNAPLPFYRFSVFSQKAVELTQTVISLGSALLSALEKRDAEGLARLRATQEISVQNAMLAVRKQQLADAQQQLDVLQKSIDLTTAKSQYYHSRPYMNAGEQSALADNKRALAKQDDATTMDTAVAVMRLLPSFNIGANGFGGSPSFTVTWGSENIAGSMAGFAGVIRSLAATMQGGASIAATLGSYDRRQDDWTFQAQQADFELKQLQSQLVQANVRVQTAQNELASQQLQVDNATAVDQFLRGKFTNTELYQYMLGQLSAVYFDAHQMALEMAHKAERCFQHELGSDATFITSGSWDSLHKGLLSGEPLLNDIRRMEIAYLEQNLREYELTKNVSMAVLDPEALLQLKNTGACTFIVPEAIFDLDHPGHYFRRLKTISLTIPCVAGPYTSVSCKLSLVDNRYRANTSSTAGQTNPLQKYAEVPGNDPRFVYNVGAIQSISTSQAQNDAGVFQLDFRDERYLPFERQGAVGTWRLEMPRTFKQFDYQTITDVILNVKYTARDGGGTFRALVEDAVGNAQSVLGQSLQKMSVDSQNVGLFYGMNVREELPDTWYMLQKTGSVPITVATDQLPAFAQTHKPAIGNATWFARVKGNPSSFAMSIGGVAMNLSPNASIGLLGAASPQLTLDKSFNVAATNAAALEDLFLVVNYTLGS